MAPPRGLAPCGGFLLLCLEYDRRTRPRWVRRRLTTRERMGVFMLETSVLLVFVAGLLFCLIAGLPILLAILLSLIHIF